MTEFEKARLEATSTPPSIDKIVLAYSRKGMKVIPVGHIGTPAQLRAKMELYDDDFGVCAFMGSAPGRLPKIKQLVRMVPEVLGQLDDQYDLKIPRISGGGNWIGDKPDDTTGLMGEWAYGATRQNRFVRFVITQGLIQLEGLPLSNGITICIKQLGRNSNDFRLGIRTDGLIYLGDLFVVFPGGFGTLVEKLMAYTNMGIDDFSRKKFLLINPIFQDPKTQSASYFWEKDIQSAIEKNHAGFVSDRTAKIINDNCLVYRPDQILTPEQMCRETVAIILAIRAAAPSFGHAGAPVSPELLGKYLVPLANNSSIGRIFDNHPLQDRSWGRDMQYLSMTSGMGTHLTPR